MAEKWESEDDATPPPTSIKIGQYRLGPIIGKGTYGKVAMGEHQITKKLVAVKSLKKEKLLKGRNLYHTSIEIRTLKLFIRHPLFIKLYDVVFTPTHVFLIMEHAGIDLQKYMLQSPHGLPIRDCRRLFQQIVAAVDFCHNQGIVHRDLKLENILLYKEQHIKIADFGLSNVMTEGEFLITNCGTIPYSAPEVHAKKTYIGPELDVWSCGVILFALLVGEFPFGTDEKQTRENAKLGRFTVPFPIEDSLQDLLVHMLTPDPIKRASIADIRYNEWFQRDLPAGLFLFPSETDVYIINSEIVQQVCQDLGLEEPEVRKALQENEPDNPINVRYIAIASDRTRGNEDLRFLLHPVIARTSENNKDKDEKWQLGVAADANCWTFMKEIFRVLKQLNFEWHVITHWHIIVRKRYRDTTRYNRMSLLMYRYDKICLVDFKNLGAQIIEGSIKSSESFSSDKWSTAFISPSGTASPNSGVSPSRVIYPSKDASPSRVISASKDASPSRVSPRSGTISPSPVIIPNKFNSPSRFISPSKTASPRRVISPSGTTSSSRLKSPSRVIPPSGTTSPRRLKSPSKVIPPSGTTSPRRLKSPNKVISPCRFKSPSRVIFHSRFKSPDGDISLNRAKSPNGVPLGGAKECHDNGSSSLTGSPSRHKTGILKNGGSRFPADDRNDTNECHKNSSNYPEKSPSRIIRVDVHTGTGECHERTSKSQVTSPLKEGREDITSVGASLLPADASEATGECSDNVPKVSPLRRTKRFITSIGALELPAEDDQDMDEGHDNSSKTSQLSPPGKTRMVFTSTGALEVPDDPEVDTDGNHDHSNVSELNPLGKTYPVIPQIAQLPTDADKDTGNCRNNSVSPLGKTLPVIPPIRASQLPRDTQKDHRKRHNSASSTKVSPMRKTFPVIPQIGAYPRPAETRREPDERFDNYFDISKLRIQGKTISLIPTVRKDRDTPLDISKLQIVETTIPSIHPNGASNQVPPESHRDPGVCHDHSNLSNVTPFGKTVIFMPSGADSQLSDDTDKDTTECSDSSSSTLTLSPSGQTRMVVTSTGTLQQPDASQEKTAEDHDNLDTSKLSPSKKTREIFTSTGILQQLDDSDVRTGKDHDNSGTSKLSPSKKTRDIFTSTGILEVPDDPQVETPQANFSNTSTLTPSKQIRMVVTSQLPDDPQVKAGEDQSSSSSTSTLTPSRQIRMVVTSPGASQPPDDPQVKAGEDQSSSSSTSTLTPSRHIRMVVTSPGASQLPDDPQVKAGEDQSSSSSTSTLTSSGQNSVVFTSIGVLQQPEDLQMEIGEEENCSSTSTSSQSGRTRTFFTSTGALEFTIVPPKGTVKGIRNASNAPEKSPLETSMTDIPSDGARHFPIEANVVIKEGGKTSEPPGARRAVPSGGAPQFPFDADTGVGLNKFDMHQVQEFYEMCASVIDMLMANKKKK